MNDYQLLNLISTQDDPVRLHLGCGGVHIKDHINIDFPQNEQPLVTTAADFCMDIVTMNLPEESVDSIQIHHVFEHFSRGVALGLLAKWHRWLKMQGQLLITVPDAEACCAGIADDRPLSAKMKLVRHIAGSHEEDKWSFHIDQWFIQRLRHTLTSLGYRVIRTKKYARDNGVYDVDILVSKWQSYNPSWMFHQATELLRESTLGPEEQSMLDIWKRKYTETVLVAGESYEKHS